MQKSKPLPDLTESEKAKFWSKVDASGGPSKCWIWTAGKFKSGYGQAWVNGKRFRSHRIAFALSGGVLNEGSNLVCHGPCNNPLCCNPAHLSAGTPKSNMDDKKRDGTAHRSITGDDHYSRSAPEKMVRGESHGCSKLSDTQVREIRARYAGGGISCKELGFAYGISGSSIERIANRKSWRHVA